MSSNVIFTFFTVSNNRLDQWLVHVYAGQSCDSFCVSCILTHTHATYRLSLAPKIICRLSRWKVIHGDCVDAIAGLPDECVDLMITSTPYFIGKNYEDSLLLSDFERIITIVHDKLYLKIKSRSSVCWQIGCHLNEANITPLDYVIQKVVSIFSDLRLRNRVIWTFEHDTHAKKWLSGKYENVVWDTKGDNFCFDLDSIRVSPKYPGKWHYKGPPQGEFSGNPLGKNPGDICSIPSVKANHVEKTSHPCQFPFTLVSCFINTLPHPVALILDLFAGANSTGIAPLEASRRFICFEMEEECFDLSLSRINQWYAGDRAVREDVPPLSVNLRNSVYKSPPHFSKRSNS